MIKLPIRLCQRTAAVTEVSALLCPGDDYSAVLALCANEEIDPTGRIFHVFDGLLVTVPRTMRGAYPGVIRLRSLAPNLFVPVDADLVPALLDDEATALAKHQGLVFLHHGQILAFDFRLPIRLDEMLVVPAHPDRGWSALPDPPFLASRIEEFVFASSGVPPDQPESAEEQANRALDPQTDPALGSPDTTPSQSNAAKGLAGRAAMGLGKGLMAFGAALGQRGLAALGAKMIQGAMGMAPRLSEAILGKQSAAIRDLLQRFKDGDIEGALKRALPLGDTPAPRGARLGAGDQLPHNDLAYRLSEFLGGTQADSGSVWTAENELREALAREYRRVAAVAMERGDHRRAALIYARLLWDFRAAAGALARGGLHRDAAAIYLAKVGDSKAAALEYEAAGDFDRAVKLYRKNRAHETAGDLLRKIGEEAAAVTEYSLAAELHSARNDHLAAGDLLLNKAHLVESAEVCFRTAWNQPTATNRGICGQRLAAIFAREGRTSDLFALLDEAGDVFGARSLDLAAAAFYHDVAGLGDQPSLSSVRLEIRDRVRLALGTRLRELASSTDQPPRSVVSALLGGSTSWTSAAVSDAEFCLAASTMKPVPANRDSASKSRRITIPGTGRVSAYCFATNSEDLFVGFEGGQVYCCQLSDMCVQLVTEYTLPVAGLATTREGLGVVVLRTPGSGSRGMLSSHVRQSNGSFDSLGGIRIEDLDEPWLTPIVSSDRGDVFGLWDGKSLSVVEAWTQCATSIVVNEAEDLAGATYGVLIKEPGDRFSAAILHGQRWWSRGEWSETLDEMAPEDWNETWGCLRHPAITPIWFLNQTLAISYIGRLGTMYWRAFRFHNGKLLDTRGGSSETRGGYLASTVVKPGLVVAVAESHIDYYSIRRSGYTTTLKGTKPGRFQDTVACVPCRRSGALVLIGTNGSLVRVPSDAPRQLPGS